MVEREPQQPEDAGPSFAAPGRGFFDGGDRRTHLEQLRHLSQWSRRMLLVTGPRGVGKSTLYRQLSATLEPRAKAARINGSLISAAREVLNAVVQGFGLAAPSEADTQLLRQLISEHARAQDRSERFCVILIDDAELLEPKALEYLVELAAESPMRVVLFGEVRLVPAVERLANTRGAGWHEIRLTGFGVDEVRAYLQWRLNQQGHDEALPFTDSQVREIARLSEGLPSRIDQMANVLLARIQSAGDGPQGRRFPTLHKAILGVLVVALAFAYLVWPPDGEEAASGVVRVEPVALPGQGEAASQVDGAQQLDGAQVETEQVTVAQQQVPAAATAEPLAGPSEPVVVKEEPAPSAAAQDVEVPAQAQAATPAAAAAAEPAAGPDAAAAAPVATPPAQTRAATPDPAPAVATQTPGVRDAAWIMSQPAAAYTLQLVSFSTVERADAYLAGQDDPASFARFRLQRDGRILHVVVYGRFDDRAAAERAATRLPASVGKVQPWIRTFGQVQEAVKTALQPAAASGGG